MHGHVYHTWTEIRCYLFVLLPYLMQMLQGRVRVLALVVKLFSVSSSVASLIHNSDLLNLLEAEVCNTDDTLVTLSVLELLYEVGQPTNISYDSVISLPFSSNYHIFYIYWFLCIVLLTKKNHLSQFWISLAYI